MSEGQYWQVSQVVPESMKVMRVGVAGAEAVRAVLWRVPLRGGAALLGKHEIGGSFDPPVEVLAGEMLCAHVGPLTGDAYPWLYFEPLQDDAWRARQAAKAERERMLAQADALDRALWEAGCPS